MVDGGGAADPGAPLDAWLVCDEHAELMPVIRRRAAELAATAAVTTYVGGGARLSPLPVRHTSHPTVGYLIEAGVRRAAWAPEFWVFPEWAAGVDLTGKRDMPDERIRRGHGDVRPGAAVTRDSVRDVGGRASSR